MKILAPRELQSTTSPSATPAPHHHLSSRFEDSFAPILKAPGSPVSDEVRAEFEPLFGLDFARVRVHHNDEAARSAKTLGALAYTAGHHVVFGLGRYAPGTPTGKGLLAHELSHVAQQWGAAVDPARFTFPQSSAAQEQDANRGALTALSGAKVSVQTRAPASIAAARTPHSAVEISEKSQAFRDKNSHLGEANLDKIGAGIGEVCAQTWEVAYAFYDYYSGLVGGEKITIMSPDQEANARKQDRVAETKPNSGTQVRSDVFSFSPVRLASLLLHEITHTGHASNFMGANDYVEGHSYAIEYYYAEKGGDTVRMKSIIDVISTGSIVLPSQRTALKELFQLSYAVMALLRRLARGEKLTLPVAGLTANDGEVLMAEFVTKFTSQSADLKAIIDHVRTNLSAYKTPPV